VNLVLATMGAAIRWRQSFDLKNEIWSAMGVVKRFMCYYGAILTYKARAEAVWSVSGASCRRIC